MLKINRHSYSSLSHDEARKLIARFFDGDTSLDDERKLYEYFATGKAHPDLQQYAAMFGWYANSLQEKPKAKRKAWRWQYVAAAAVLICLIGSAAVKIVQRQSNDTERLAEVYAGSYIIRNGVKITDMNKVLPEVIKNEKYAERLLAVCEKNNNSHCNIKEPSVDDIINSIPDPEIREEFAK